MIDHETAIKSDLAKATSVIHDRLDWSWLEGHCPGYRDYRAITVERKRSEKSYRDKYIVENNFMGDF